MLRKLLAPITVLAVVMGFSVAPVAAQSDRYAFTDLGVSGGLDSHAWTLNAGGQVTGHADTSPGSGTRGFHAFLWTPSTPNGTTGSMIDLGTLPGGLNSAGYGINSSGAVVGTSLPPDMATSSAFLDNGTMVDLGSFGGIDSAANGINASWQVVGSSKDRSNADHAFLWAPDRIGATKGHLYDLGIPQGAAATIAYAINSGGTVTGVILDADYYAHAFVWKPTTANGTAGTMIALVEPPGATGSAGQAINRSGVIAGSVELAGGSHPFIYDTTMHDLGTLAGGHNAWAYSINSSGVVVGWGDTAVRSNDHAFIYANGTMTDLNKLLPGSVKSSHVILTTATGINDLGQITGVATVDGHAHGYLLTPDQLK
jgi:probable HAF family extracellular repeat protein